MTPITITKAMRKSYPTGDQVVVRAEEGRYTCKDESLFDTLAAAEGKTIEVEIDGSLIIGVNAPADDVVEEVEDDVPATPFPEDEEEEEAPAAPAPKPATKKADPKPAAKKAEAPAAPAAPANEGDDDEEVDAPVIAQKTEGLTDADQFEPNTLFPLLRAEEIECRIGQTDQNGKWLTLLLYKNARCDQDRLDAKYGPLGWQTSYQILDGQLFCTVSVRNPDTGEWVSKTDVGTPSNTEAEKGRVSDAFKRSCVCWGSGRELYSAPEIKIYADKVQIKQNNKGKWVCYDKFAVKSIAYDDQRRISKLEIYSAQSRGVVFKFGK